MKTIIKILSAFAVVSVTFIIIDIVFGKVADYVTRNIGLTKQNYVMSGRDKYDLLFIGSSRSNHHYDTPYITDSLKLKSFNAGEDGRGLTYQYPELYAYLSCYTPDVIILDVLPNLDGEWKNRMAMLYPLANKYDIIVKTAEKVDLKNKFLLLSSLYRYNSNLPSELYGVRYPFKATENYGYVPIPIKKSREGTLKEDSLIHFSSHVDSVEYQILVDMINICKKKNIKLIGVLSPIYGKVNRSCMVDDIFKKHGVPIIDNTAFRLPIDPKKYFKDATHLNRRGAREYTKFFMHQLTDSLNVFHKIR